MCDPTLGESNKNWCEKIRPQFGPDSDVGATARRVFFERGLFVFFSFLSCYTQESQDFVVSTSQTMFNNNGGGDQQNLDEFTQELFSKLLTATRISNNLPTEDEYQFYTSFKPFKTKMNEIGKRLLDLTQNFLQHDESTKAPIINDSDDVDEVTEKFDEVVDFVDRLIEKVVWLIFLP